jgi:hypothetical protein
MMLVGTFGGAASRMALPIASRQPAESHFRTISRPTEGAAVAAASAGRSFFLSYGVPSFYGPSSPFFWQGFKRLVT